MKNLQDYADSVSVVVSSCDRFFDAWRPFAFFFRKFWADCPFKVYLIVNRLRIRSEFIRPIRVGRDRDWATNMQIALQQVTTPYVLYMQEDYFLTEEVNREQLATDMTKAFQQHIDSLCFFDLSLLEPDFAEIDTPFGVVPKSSKGRTRLQTTLWKRDALASVLKPGENAWEMEARGSERTERLDILSYARKYSPPISYLMSAIVRGLWTPEALQLCQEHNVQIDPAFRPSNAAALRTRRLRRGLGRVSFAAAYAKQFMQPVELD
jgi:hypothetical protein